MIRRHPSKKVLRAWLDLEDLPDVDEHVLTCERCSDDLEALAGAEADSSIRRALEEVLAPPTGLAERIEQGVVRRLDSRRVFGYVADLFGAGLETSVLLFDQPEDEQ